VVDGRLFEAVEVGVERVQWSVLLNNNNVYQFLDYFSAQARKKMHTFKHQKVLLVVG